MNIFHVSMNINFESFPSTSMKKEKKKRKFFFKVRKMIKMIGY